MSALSTMQNHLRHLKALRQRFVTEDSPDHPAVVRLDARIAEAEKGIKALRTM